MTKGTLAITGASGFVGRRLVSKALASDYTVRSLRRARADRPSADDRLESVDWDLDAGGAVAALDGVDKLVHAGAYLPTSYLDSTEAYQCWLTNAWGTYNLVRKAVEASVPQVVIMSSANAYAPGVGPATEDAPMYPSERASFYLSSKLCGELFALDAARQSGTQVSILRLSAVYGPGAATGVVASFIGRLQRGEPIKLTNGGAYQSDLVFVDDVVDAALEVVSRSKIGTYNIGSGTTTSLLMMVEELANLLSIDRSELVSIEPQSAPVDGFRTLDVSKARDDLGFNPTSLSLGLAKTIGSAVD